MTIFHTVNSHNDTIDCVTETMENFNYMKLFPFLSRWLLHFGGFFLNKTKYDTVFIFAISLFSISFIFSCWAAAVALAINYCKLDEVWITCIH